MSSDVDHLGGWGFRGMVEGVLGGGRAREVRSRSAIIRRFLLLLLLLIFFFLQLVQFNSNYYCYWRDLRCVPHNDVEHTSASDLFHKHNKPRAGGTYLCWRYMCDGCGVVHAAPNIHTHTHIYIHAQTSNPRRGPAKSSWLHEKNTLLLYMCVCTYTIYTRGSSVRAYTYIYIYTRFYIHVQYVFYVHSRRYISGITPLVVVRSSTNILLLLLLQYNMHQTRLYVCILLLFSCTYIGA